MCHHELCFCVHKHLLHDQTRMQMQGLWAKGELQSSDLTSDQMSPAQSFTQQLSDAPQACGNGNHRTPQQSVAAFITLPVHPAPPMHDAVHNQVLLKRSSNFAQKWLCNSGHGGASQTVRATSSQGPATYSTKQRWPHQGVCRYLHLDKFSALEPWLQFPGWYQISSLTSPDTCKGLQTGLILLPSDSTNSWGTGLLSKSDARWARADP